MKGKTSTQVDIPGIQELIKLAEEKHTYSGLSNLFTDVARMYKEQNLLNAEKMTPAIVGLRVKKNKLIHVTKVGKRGREKGSGPVSAGREVYVLSPANKEHIKKLRSYIVNEGFSRSGERSSPRHKQSIRLVDRIEKGSLRAAINLKCLECTNFQTQEIKDCQCKDTCPLWSLRSYQ